MLQNPIVTRKYKVRDRVTGKEYTLDWDKPTEPNEFDVEQEISRQKKSTLKTPEPIVQEEVVNEPAKLSRASISKFLLTNPETPPAVNEAIGKAFNPLTDFAQRTGKKASNFIQDNPKAFAASLIADRLTGNKPGTFMTMPEAIGVGLDSFTSPASIGTVGLGSAVSATAKGARAAQAGAKTIEEIQKANKLTKIAQGTYLTNQGINAAQFGEGTYRNLTAKTPEEEESGAFSGLMGAAGLFLGSRYARNIPISKALPDSAPLVEPPAIGSSATPTKPAPNPLPKTLTKFGLTELQFEDDIDRALFAISNPKGTPRTVTPVMNWLQEQTGLSADELNKAAPIVRASTKEIRDNSTDKIVNVPSLFSAQLKQKPVQKPVVEQKPIEQLVTTESTIEKVKPQIKLDKGASEITLTNPNKETVKALMDRGYTFLAFNKDKTMKFRLTGESAKVDEVKVLGEDGVISSPVVQEAVAPTKPKIPVFGGNSGNLRYNYGDTPFELQFADDVDKALFTVSDHWDRKTGSLRAKSSRDAQYMDFLKQQFPDKTEPEIRRIGREIREYVRPIAKQGKIDTKGQGGDLSVPKYVPGTISSIRSENEGTRPRNINPAPKEGIVNKRGDEGELYLGARDPKPITDYRTAMRESMATTNEPKRTKFLLPDGTRISALGEHAQAVNVSLETNAIKPEKYYDHINNALEQGVVRIIPGRNGGIEIGKPLTRQQAQIIADDWNSEHREDLNADAFQGTNEIVRTKIFTTPIDSISLMNWSNRAFRPLENMDEVFKTSGQTLKEKVIQNEAKLLKINTSKYYSYEQLERAIESENRFISSNTTGEGPLVSLGKYKTPSISLEEYNRRLMQKLESSKQGLQSDIGAIGDIFDKPKSNVTADRWRAIVKELDDRKANDFEYRDILSTGTKNTLKKGETWRSRVLDYARISDEVFYGSKKSNDAGELGPFDKPNRKTNKNQDPDLFDESDESYEIKVPKGKADKFDKLRSVIRQAKPMQGEQAELYARERAKRFEAVSQVPLKGERGYFEMLGKLKGELPKIQFEPIRDKFTQKEIDFYNDEIRRTLPIDTDAIHAMGGLRKLFEGNVPTKSELTQLDRVFGKVFGSEIIELHGGLGAVGMNITRKAINSLKTLKTIYDLSAILNQNKGRMWSPEFYKSIPLTIKAFPLQKVYDQTMNMIKAHPKFERAKGAKLSFLDEHVRNEEMQESFVDNIPGVKASNRAMNLPGNYNRFMTFYRLSDLHDKAVYKPGELELLESKAREKGKIYNDPDDFAIARMLNITTRRGRLPKREITLADGTKRTIDYEQNADDLNLVFFSPRNQWSILQYFNPKNYTTGPKAVQWEFRKSLMAIIGFGLLSTYIKKELFGAKVETDPTSSDFMKAQFGNTRDDPFSGLQQPFVLAMRMATGKSKSIAGNVTDLNAGGFRDRIDVIGSYLRSKESPFADILHSAAAGSDYLGEKFDITDPWTLPKKLPPMSMEMAYEIVMDDSNLMALIPLGILGESIQTFEPKKKSSGRSNLQNIKPIRANKPSYVPAIR